MKAIGNYNHKVLEEKWDKRWEEMDLIEKLRKKNADGPKFYYLDGPPYANAPPHIGHALTRALRESVMKYKQLRGHNVWAQPGFDCHGLPVEVIVEKQIGTRSKNDIKKFGVEKFNKLCREHATKYLNLWGDFYKKMGSGALWDLRDPYLTLNNEYIDSAWHFFKKADEKDLIYKGKASVAWCPRCETALSGYEVAQDYKEIKDISIYIKFRLKRNPKEFLFVWTTTPWTLPGNVAIALNPKYEYAKVKVGDETWIMAKELVDQTMQRLEINIYEIGETFKGDALDGEEYEYLLMEQVPMHAGFAHKVILADFVTIEEGTGCVHTAPGHGPDDYNIGVKLGLKTLCPVDEAGKLTEEAGKYKGMFVFDANDVIVKDLEANSVLAKADEITHRYPHCWRCKSKLIFIATDQWFLRVEPLKQKMIEENSRIKWVPDWAGKKRFHEWLVNARDWCLSRQRFWGIPLPIWVCEKCGKYDIIGSFDELRRRNPEVPEDLDLHRPYIDKIVLKCGCGGRMHRVEDTTDVWFDSGASTWASFGYPKKKQLFEDMFPIDFITEAIDQTRGWFYTLLVESIVMFDKAPYESVLVNGLVLDDRGEKMSKSKGNVVDPFQTIEEYGADTMRWYLLWNVSPWEDTKFNAGDLRIVHGTLGTLWNVYRFILKYHSLDNYKGGAPKKLEPEDKWILSRLENLNKNMGNAFDILNPNVVARGMRDFILNDLSRDYIKFIRSRLKNAKNKTAVYYVLSEVMKKLSVMIIPVTPFIAEEIYEGFGGKKQSVHLESWPAHDETRLNKKLEEKMELAKKVIEGCSNLRNTVGINLRQPLSELHVVSEDPQVEEALDELGRLVSDQTNVKSVVFNKIPPVGDFATLDADKIKLFLDKKIDKKLLAEGMTREVIRRIQQTRKELELTEKDKISVNVVAHGDFTAMLDGDEIRRQTNTKDLKMSNAPVMQGKKKEWKLNDYEVAVVVSK